MNQVMLETTNVKTGTVKVTGPYERGILEIWVKHARPEYGEEIFKWKIQEIK